MFSFCKSKKGAKAKIEARADDDADAHETPVETPVETPAPVEVPNGDKPVLEVDDKIVDSTEFSDWLNDTLFTEDSIKDTVADRFVITFTPLQSYSLARHFYFYLRRPIFIFWSAAA